jgi:hypothetical protein
MCQKFPILSVPWETTTARRRNRRSVVPIEADKKSVGDYLSGARRWPAIDVLACNVDVARRLDLAVGTSCVHERSSTYVRTSEPETRPSSDLLAAERSRGPLPACNLQGDRITHLSI